MTKWVEWNSGECPILDAKAGQYELKLRDGRFIKPNHPFAEDYNWHHACSGSISSMHDIIAYRLIEKEQSDLDWLEGEIKNLVNSIDMQNTWWVRRNDVLDLIKQRKEAKHD